ncbi:MAG: calcium/sodium antiporter [Kiloniellales bacterium]
MHYILVAAGLGLLLLGGDFLVRGAVSLARNLGVSPLIIGLTIIAYGTSAPELLVSMEAHLTGASGIAAGNVVGSNIANILLIIGCGALIYPIACAPGSLRLNGPVLLSATLLLVLIGLAGVVTLWVSVPMLVLLIAFSLISYRAERRGEMGGRAEAERHIKEVQEFADRPMGLPRSIFAITGGLIGVVVGSHALVTGAVEVARTFGISEVVIGLTLVAIGTSLPELATTTIAALRRHSDVALGNVFGSNLFNTLGIMGVLPFFGDLPIPPRLAAFDLWVMLAATIVFLFWTWRFKGIGRRPAAVFLLAYIAYIASQYWGLGALAAPAA